MFLIRNQVTKSHLAVRVSHFSLLTYAPVSAIVSAWDNLIVAFVYRNCFNKTQISPLGHDPHWGSSSGKRVAQVS
uniref:7TM_GPCR_Srx domain-containing protein n=1 Tax=Panagrellus redivivus TaxID=6233 RepID=A0A7E4VZ17_PANRE